MKNKLFVLFFLASLTLFAQSNSTGVPAQPELINGKERYFVQFGSMSNLKSDTLRNAFNSRNNVVSIGFESVVSRFASFRLSLGYSAWAVNKDNSVKFFKDSVRVEGKNVSDLSLSQKSKMQVVSISPELKLFYPGTTRKFTGYFVTGLTGHFAVKNAKVVVEGLKTQDQNLLAISSLNANLGLGAEYHLNDLLMVYVEGKYSHEFFNFSIANHSKWANSSLALGVAVKFGNE